MKYLRFTFFLVTIFLFFSCQKEEIQPKPDNNNFNDNTEVDNVSLLVDKDWVLVSSNFYYENPKIYFNHPPSSYLNPFYGPDCQFDYFDEGVTTWRFNTNQFFLNGDLQNDPPDLGGINNQSIYVRVDKSPSIVVTRIIEILSITDNRLEVRVGEIGNLIGNPYSRMVFRSVPSITETNPTVPTNYLYQGVLGVGDDEPNLNTSDLHNTTWVVTKFYNGFGYDEPNDTIVFEPNGQYKVNGSTNNNRTYNVNTIVGNTSVNLNLNDFITMGGSNYSILTSPNFIEDGVVNGSQAEDILNTNSSNKFIWMEKIQ